MPRMCPSALFATLGTCGLPGRAKMLDRCKLANFGYPRQQRLIRAHAAINAREVKSETLAFGQVGFFAVDHPLAISGPSRPRTHNVGRAAA